MVDRLDSEARSDNMRRIRSGGTAPEIAVRRCARALGYGFRLHRRDLPGKPDLAFIGRRKVIFVHGCFWHQHTGCAGGRIPKSNSDYWVPKLTRNVERDAAHVAALEAMGWNALIVWACELKDPAAVGARLKGFLG